MGEDHQNSVSERAIKTVVSWEGVILIHASIHWPEKEDVSLRPFLMCLVYYLDYLVIMY